MIMSAIAGYKPTCDSNDNPVRPLMCRPFLCQFLVAMSILITHLLSFIMLRVEHVLPQMADAIIVLGGDEGDRADLAAVLYSARRAPKVLVTGIDDCTTIAERLVQSGVPASAIILEPNSRSTWENARYSAPVLRHHGVRKAIIVTSWPHSRRAMACFRTCARDLIFYSAPSGDDSRYHLPEWPAWKAILFEYAKTIRYVYMGRIRWRTLRDTETTWRHPREAYCP